MEPRIHLYAGDILASIAESWRNCHALLNSKDKQVLMDSYHKSLSLLREACSSESLEDDLTSLMQVDETLYGPIFARVLQVTIDGAT
jgi:hypothetical protein